MKRFVGHLAATMLGLVLVGCASTSSVMVDTPVGAPLVAVLPLEGPLGEQAVDLISQELATAGIATVERARTVAFVAVDTDLSESSPSAVQAFSEYGSKLGVRYLFVGTVSTQGGPLYSFDHVNLTLRLVDVQSGKTRWIGRYGNALWTSAISTQGDLQRGARDLVKEFIRAGGPALLKSPS